MHYFRMSLLLKTPLEIPMDALSRISCSDSALLFISYNFVKGFLAITFLLCLHPFIMGETYWFTESCLSVCLSVCPSVRLSVCLSVCHTFRFRSLTQTVLIQSSPNLMKMFVGTKWRPSSIIS